MAREHAQIRLDIWNDDDFRDLTGNAQHLYFMLMTAPTLSYCGVADWRPGRFAALVNDWSSDTVLEAARELRTNLFIVTDDDSEEVLIRSFVKYDGIMRNQKMATAMATAAAGVASKTIRGVIVHTLQKMYAAEPEMSGFKSATAKAMLHRDAVDPATITVDDRVEKPMQKPVPMPVPNTNQMPVQNTDQIASVTPITTLSGYQSPSPAPTPTPTPNTSNEVLKERGPRERATRLPEGWMPPQELIDKTKADCPLVDLGRSHEMFSNHWAAKSGKDATKVDWSRAWRNWMLSDQDRAERRPGGRQAAPSRKEQTLAFLHQEFLNADDDTPPPFGAVTHTTQGELTA